MTSQPSAQKNPINSSRKSISGCEAHPINRPLIRVAVGPRVDLSCCRCPVVEARPAGWRDRPRARTLAGGAIRLDAAMMAGVSLLALLAAGGSLACSEIPGYRGSPSEDVALEAWTLQPTPNGGGGTCRCCGLCPQRADCSAISYRADTHRCLCGLCHQRADCSALSYRADTHRCLLFGGLASYDSFQVSPRRLTVQAPRFQT